MKYAICNETFDGWEHKNVCEYISKLGYTGLEIAPYTIRHVENIFSETIIHDMKSQAHDYGIEIIGTHWLLAKTSGFHLTTSDSPTRSKTADYLLQLIELTAKLGGGLMVLGSPLQRNRSEDINESQADGYMIEILCKLLPILESTQITLCLEPLGPQETNYVNTAEEAMQIITAINSPFVKLHLDVKAMSTERESIPQLITNHAKMLHHFHANDPNLRGPGFGDVDFREILMSLYSVHYPGWISVEVFDYNPTPEIIAAESITYLKSCEAYALSNI